MASFLRTASHKRGIGGFTIGQFLGVFAIVLAIGLVAVPTMPHGLSVEQARRDAADRIDEVRRLKRHQRLTAARQYVHFSEHVLRRPVWTMPTLRPRELEFFTKALVWGPFPAPGGHIDWALPERFAKASTATPSEPGFAASDEDGEASDGDVALRPLP